MRFEVHSTRHVKKTMKQWGFRGNRRLLQRLEEVVELLSVFNAPARFILREQWHDHQLQGKLASHRELHLDFDCLLLYYANEEAHRITLVAFLTHDELKKWSR